MMNLILPKLFWSITLSVFIGASATHISLPIQENSPTLSNSQTIFQPILSNLQSQTSIPLKLPTYIPKSEGLNPQVAVLATASNNAYEIVISDPGCSGADACSYGVVSGEKITAIAPSIESQFAFMNDPTYQPSDRSSDPLGFVTLAKGVRGYFVPWVLGSSYSNAKVIWSENGDRYEVGIKKGREKDVVAMANSAIVANHL